MTRCLSFASLASAVVLASTLGAESRAILIGVPRTPSMPGVSDLEGPENDVEALRRVLVEEWGFRNALIRTLVGPESTRGAILGALDQLAVEAVAGDHALVYFSGHGVSAYEATTKGFGMRADTGGLLPADILGNSAAEILSRLVVGSRDLRPRFELLDRSGVETLVLFDAGYSGDSLNGTPISEGRPGGPSGTASSSTSDREFAELAAAARPPDWPYERVVYISASARHEMAFEISAEQARTTHPTIDGKPHGAFTNGLLVGLRGDADYDQDGRISYSELNECVVDHVLRYGQTPQLHALAEPLLERPVFGRTVTPGASGGGPAPVGRVHGSTPQAKD